MRQTTAHLPATALVAVLALVLCLGACTSVDEAGATKEVPASTPLTKDDDVQDFSVEATTTPIPEGAATLAMASMVPTSGSDAQGLIVFDPVDDDLIVRVEVTGLDPGRHGFHIHENGDCSAVDGSSAGEHFDPDGSKAGDLDDLDSDAAGSAFVDILAEDLALWGPNSVIDRSVVIHSAINPDVRIACGVIEATTSN